VTKQSSEHQKIQVSGMKRQTYFDKMLFYWLLWRLFSGLTFVRQDTLLTSSAPRFPGAQFQQLNTCIDVTWIHDNGREQKVVSNWTAEWSTHTKHEFAFNISDHGTVQGKINLRFRVHVYRNDHFFSLCRPILSSVEIRISYGSQ